MPTYGRAAETIQQSPLPEYAFRDTADAVWYTDCAKAHDEHVRWHLSANGPAGQILRALSVHFDSHRPLLIQGYET